MWEAESVCAAGAGRGAGGRGRLEGRGGAPRLVAVQGADVREKLDRARLEAPVLEELVAVPLSERHLLAARHAHARPVRHVPEGAVLKEALGLAAVDGGDPHGELSHPPLLQHRQHRARQRLLGRERHLVHAPKLARRARLWRAVAVRPVDRLELHVVCRLCVDEDLDELPAGHDELWHHVHRPVAQLAQLRLGRRGAGLELFKELVDVERGRGAAVVVVAVEVEHLFPRDREQPAQQALLHPRAEHNSIPLLAKRRLPVVHREEEEAAAQERGGEVRLDGTWGWSAHTRQERPRIPLG
mmetsp:Transcript_12430/g.37475  ORF Transcript_12430/g.37475 Transcript_12430/m.37475 type:complete len:299 (+) Transcript_12430:1259-2155(+)